MRVTWNPGMQIDQRAKQINEPKSSSQKALAEASQELESLFLHQLLSEMRKTVQEGDLFGDRRSEKMFESMLDQEMSKEMAKGGGIGLSKMIYQQMVKHVSDND